MSEKQQSTVGNIPGSESQDVSSVVADSKSNEVDNQQSTDKREEPQFDEDFLKAIANRDKGKTPEEIQRHRLEEVRRIRNLLGASPADIWGISPKDLQPAERNFTWKKLMFDVHEDRHLPANKADAQEASKIVGQTKECIDDPEYMPTSARQDEQHGIKKGGPEYLHFYRKVSLIQALIGLMMDVDNQHWINELNKVNESIKAENIRLKKQELQGTFRIEKFQPHYGKAQKLLTEAKALSKEKGNVDKQKHRLEEIKSALGEICEQTRILCDVYGLPRSFGWPTSSVKHEAPHWWTDANKQRNQIDDGMPSTEEYRKAKDLGMEQIPDGSTQEASTSDRELPNRGQQSADRTDELHTTTKCVHWDEALRHGKTFDGCAMKAAKKVSSNSWSIIVEEAEGYRMRTGAECGGRLYINGIVEKLPRLGVEDKKVASREKARERPGFLTIAGIVQQSGTSYCLTKWNNDDGSEDEVWMSRTTLISVLGSQPLVDNLISACGGYVLRSGLRKDLFSIGAERKTQQKLLGQSIGADDSVARVLANGSLFKNPVFRATDLFERLSIESKPDEKMQE